MAVAAVYALAAGFLAALWIVTYATDRDFSYVSRDPSALADEKLFFGMLSQAGGLCWAMAAGIALFAAAQLAIALGADRRAGFLAFVGAITAMLGVDDVFLVHENVFPDLTGLPEHSLFVVYVIVMGVGLLVFRDRVLADRSPFLPAALALFATSIVADVLLEGDDPSSVHFLIEDGAKFLAIVSWLLFVVHLGTRSVQALRSPEAAVADGTGARRSPDGDPIDVG